MSKRYGRGTDWTKITTSKLKEILDHPYCLGIDGVDYGPYKEELTQEMYSRQNRQSERDQKAHDKNLKARFKAIGV